MTSQGVEMRKRCSKETMRGILRGLVLLACACGLLIESSTVSMAATGGGTPARASKTAGLTSGPVINVWYGSPQKFGQEGVPQRWVNILGNVSTSNPPLSYLKYSLNGSDDVYLSVGPDTRRLAQSGDFNIDILTQYLSPGNNTVLITAQDNLGVSSTQSVTIKWTPGKVWPSMYTVKWSSASSLSDSVQVVDGLWATDGGGVRTTQPGYDRIIAIGDTTWTDYEVQAQVYVHAIDNSDTAYDGTNGGPAVGFLFRWNGHTDMPTFVPPITQPLSGYQPYGAIGWFHYRNHNPINQPDQWELLGNSLADLGHDESSPLPIGVLYNFKMRVKSSTGGTYSFKAWPNGSSEPASWLLSGSTGNSSDPTHGSFALLAHHVDVSFGEVDVSPLGTLTTPTLVSPSNGSNGVFGGTALVWNKVSTAGSYDVQVSTSSSFTSGMLVNQTGVRDTTAGHSAFSSPRAARIACRAQTRAWD